MRMFEVPHGQDPYNAIGKYIRDHINIIEDVIAVIEIDGVETNQLFMVDMHEDGYFIWKSDWYEGEEKVVLMDFFPVSEAINSSVQPERKGTWIEADALMEAINTCPKFGVDERDRLVPWNEGYEPYIRLRDVVIVIAGMSTIEPERKKGKWIIKGEYIDCSVCRREKWSRVPYENLVKRFKFCPNCGADMRGDQNE